MSVVPRKPVLACLDDSPVAGIVRRPPSTWTRHGRRRGRRSVGSGSVEATLLDELARDDVVLGVLGSRRLTTTPDLLGHVAQAVVTTSRRRRS